METKSTMTTADRIDQVMQHLGINKAHFAGRHAEDWTGSAIDYPERILSNTILALAGFDEQALNNLAPRVQIISGDQGYFADVVQQVTDYVPASNLKTIPDYELLHWSDVTVDYKDYLTENMLQFMAKHQVVENDEVPESRSRKGEVAGISYHIQGSGMPLILLPLSLAPSQWEPLIPLLSAHYCTISLGGVYLGIMPGLEKRGEAAGWQRMVKNLMSETYLQAGQTVLEVGSGTGVNARWLAHNTNRENPITGIDLNAYFVRESTQLLKQEGLEDTIRFQKEDATALSFPDNSFDVSYAVTVLEEGDADKMLAEMLRVTKPGGKVAVIVRANDIPFIYNLDVKPALLVKINQLPGAKSEKGCADASLYQRFHQAGLTQVKQFPQLATFDQDNMEMLNFIMSNSDAAFNEEEKAEWDRARVQAEAEGTFFICRPHHCAVGTKV